MRQENIYVPERQEILDSRRAFKYLKCFKYPGMQNTVGSFYIINPNRTENLFQSPLDMEKVVWIMPM